MALPALPPPKPPPKTRRAEAAVPRKSWFARFMDALIESRMQQAQREIKVHAHLLLPDIQLDERGNRLVKTDTGDMPFGGW